jgi:hypothetical protein
MSQNLNLILSSDCSQIGTGSSHSPRSAIESFRLQLGDDTGRMRDFTMRWLGIIAALLLMCESAAAKSGVSPAAAIPIVSHWVKFSDPQEQAFQVDVPQGWKVAGGTTRRNALQYRSWVETVSPDGGTIVAINDPNEWSYVIPTPLLAMAGFGEGSLYSGGGGTVYTVARYRDGRQFAVEWTQRKLATLCSGIKLGGSRERPELTSQINAVAGASGIHHDAGEASFACAKGPLKLTAFVLADVVSISGQAGAIWYAETIAGFLSPSPVAGIAAGLLAHMLKSVQVNPAWVARNSNMAVQVSQTEAQTNAAISDSIMRGWEDRGAATDRVMEEGSRARLGIDIYSDPETGNKYTVANDHNFYWVNPSGTVIGTDTDTAPKGFSRLARVPP